MSAVRDYILVTAAYWGFTLTDGALRMLVLLHFHRIGYSPVELAFLFLLYESAGVVANPLGGWIAARTGLKATLVGGLALQVAALAMLALVEPGWAKGPSVAYVMAAQALSGIAKDLTKMSAKSAIRSLVPADAHASLFRWVAALTGSKNALKGVGFFLGGLLLTVLGYAPALWAMAAALVLILCGAALSLPREMGRARAKPAFSSLLSTNRAINALSAARFFLFGARDVWFVVAVPVFLASTLGWGFAQVGTFLALWVIGYGVVQSIAPTIVALWTKGAAPRGGTAVALAVLLALIMAGMPIALAGGVEPSRVVLGGLAAFGVVFALNSAVHSYLVLAHAGGERVAMDVGFYYMANAGGRLVGTLLSGIVFQIGGLAACLWTSAAFVTAAGVLSLLLPRGRAAIPIGDGRVVGAAGD
ncbi:MAG TPA: organoarsenical effux MFS transporter ArsJ [Planctomycetota bacterium]|nr:organoarsenical effux MFS transporter ArsJ [Planctomycetota bacterium]